MQAYETHMQDVQRELFLLREKVHTLATDETRALKMKSLEIDQNRMKAESIQLDIQNDEIRKKIRVATMSMQSVERDRDWLIKRLRKAKRSFTNIEQQYELEKSKLSLFEDSGILSGEGSLNISLGGQSSTFLNVQSTKKKLSRLSSSPAIMLRPDQIKSKIKYTPTDNNNPVLQLRKGDIISSVQNTNSNSQFKNTKDGSRSWRERILSEVAVSRSLPNLPG